MANKKPKNFDPAPAVDDNWEFYYQPTTGNEQKASATQLVSYLQGKGLTDKTYTHTQATAATTWAISHGLNKTPNVVVVDGTGQQIFGQIQVVDSNNINILFNQPVSGTATLN